MAGLRDAGARPVMSALPPRVTPVSKDDALVLVLEAYIETLKAENAILRRWLAAAEARAAQETEKAEAAVAELRLSRGSGRGRPPLAMTVRGISAATSWRPSAPGPGGGGWRRRDEGLLRPFGRRLGACRRLLAGMDRVGR
jgi:hypothetical protein